MSVANRGTKRRCPHCGAAFYDLARDPIICPKCQTLYVEVQRPPARSGGSRLRNIAVAPVDVDREAAAEEIAVFDEDEVLERDDMDQDMPAEDEADETGERD